MKDFIKGKFFTILTVCVTVVLAGVAIFTAVRLYQLRQESISPTNPESEPAAWDCKSYVFSMSESGSVTVSNSSGRSESPQKAEVYIDNQLVATFDVPALPSGQSATLGTVSVPSEPFSWKVIGTADCQNSGNITPGPVSCKELKFTLTKITATPKPTDTITPTLTPTSTPAPTNTPKATPTPEPTTTDRPIGGISPTPEPTNTPQPTSTPTSTPIPTGQQIAAQISPTPGGHILPDAGISFPTVFALFSGIFIIMAAILLAL